MAITLRDAAVGGVGRPLTIQEVDTNFSELSIAVGSKLNTTAYTAADVLAKLLTVDTDTAGINATTLRSMAPTDTNTANSLVMRNSSGNFTAGTITASLIGNVTGNVSGTALNVTGIVPVLNGGTGATSTSAALDNLLPAGELPGYVLKTSGPGTYFWGAETGATTLIGTRINTSRVSYNATAGQTVFTGVGQYTIGSGQLRVYINGIRQFPDAYTETSTTTFTLTDPVAAGTKVMAEVDSSINYDMSATAVSFTPTGTIASTNVQNAIAELLAELSPFIVPAGGIIIWSGSAAAIPSGWALCNGSSGTPDLRDRFVVGAGSSYAVGATGGSKDAIVVAHTHTGTTDNVGNHNHTIPGNTGTGGAGQQSSFVTDGNFNPYTVPTGDAGAHNHTFTTNSTGSSGANANLPPYYSLCYIMKL